MNRVAPHRILMTADTVGGVWTYALELARALQPFGVEVALATMGKPMSASQRQEVRSLANVEAYESAFKLEWMEDPWKDVRLAGDWLLELESSFRPSVVHLNGYAHGNLPMKAPKVVVGHSCVLSWWEAVHGHPAPAEWARYRQAVTAGLRAADLVIAPSAAMLQALQGHYGPFAASGVIANGRQLPASRGAPKQNYILTVGRLWDEAKNVAALQAVALELPWPVYVAGEDRPEAGEQQSCANVTRLGKLSARDLAPWFERASIYALPARYEPFGLSILEAALSDCALVLGDIPSLRDNWDGAAVFVPPSNSGALKDALCELISNPGLRHEHAARARQVAAAFTPERMAEQYASAYGEVLHRRGGDPEAAARPVPFNGLARLERGRERSQVCAS